MNDRTRTLVLEQADRFYAGDASSVEAYRVIDAAANSAWNWYAGILNDTRALFDGRVNERIAQATR